jgi:hypothetical protein
MENYEQLVLFNLEAYTCGPSATAQDGENPVEEAQSCLEYEQLELELFLPTSHKTPLRVVSWLGEQEQTSSSAA